MKPVTKEDLEQLFRLSVDMLSIIRANGTFKHVNPAWTDVLGWTHDELVNTPYMNFVHPDDHAETAKEAARLAAGERTIDFENRYRAKDGSYHWMSWRVTPSEDGTLLYCATHDVTETHRVRAELDRRAREVEAARAEAVRANLAKSNFLSRMSHELRTPLNAILGFAQLFERDRMTPEERDNIRYILDGGRHLLELINEVLDISRVESGTLALSNEPVEVDEAIRTAVNIIQPLASQQGIEVTVQPLPAEGLAVLADRQRLRQILLNLLSNAVKYNRPRGSITVTVHRRSDRVTIDVADSGAGIPAQLLSQLFQPFERLGAETTSIEGTGLGLALSRALCEAMGGRLEVHSVVDQGSTFTIDLAETKLHAPAERAPLEVADDVVAAPGGHALVIYIEDNVANVRLMERILARRPGLRLMHAAEGRSGIGMVEELRPAMVLLDLQLPGIPGEVVLRELWKNPVTRQIPVVVLTADATRGLPQRLMSAGARACLTKPLDVQQVLRTIDESLTQERSADHG